MGTTLDAAAWRRLMPIAVPIFAAVVLVVFHGSPSGVGVVIVGTALVGAVLVGVHHAEAIAHRVGEPFGALILAVAVTVIEVGLVVSLMASKGADASTLARDTVFAAVMIVVNGVVGLGLVVGSLRHRTVVFRAEGTTGLLATLATLTTLTLVLPRFTTSTPGPTFATSQLVFAGVASAGVYAVFLFVQTVQDRGSFLPVDDVAARAALPAPTPHESSLALHLSMLAVSLVAVVGLAKAASPVIERGVKSIGATPAAVGVVIAMIVLLPETIAATRAARRNDMQSCLNLALGSGLASIGLTIPAVAVATIWLDGPLVLGLDAKAIVLLVLTFGVAAITLSSGRATLLQGTVHLSIFAAYVCLAIEP